MDSILKGKKLRKQEESFLFLKVYNYLFFQPVSSLRSVVAIYYTWVIPNKKNLSRWFKLKINNKNNTFDLNGAQACCKGIYNISFLFTNIQEFVNMFILLK